MAASRFSQSRCTPLIFITGTDTGVGKTLLTGLLLSHLRTRGVDALAVKPFCSGGLADTSLLSELQKESLRIEEISPFRYRLPLAPAVAADLEGNRVNLSAAMRHVEGVRGRCECLLVEGCGGLLTPLGKQFTALDMISLMGGHVIVVAPNRLGVINHILLTVRALESVPMESLQIVLMNPKRRPDRVTKTNVTALVERLSCNMIVIPYLGGNACKIGSIKAHGKFLEKTLAALLPSDSVLALLEAAVVEATEKIGKKRGP